MSYFVRILRRSRGKAVPIGRAEVEAVLATRPDLEAASKPDGTLEIRVKAMGESSPVLEWWKGEISAQDPDELALALMLELAKPLRARVRGAEMETYRSPTETYLHPDDAKEARADEAATTMRRWAKSLAPLGIAVLLALAYGYCTARR